MNVLLMMVDELSWWALGHVDGRVQTPNIDRLAARSRRFTQAYTPSPICVPTRAAIATGRYVHEIGHWSSAEPYDGAIRGWAHHVRDAGLDCVSIGKLHYRSQLDDYGFSHTLEPIHVLNGEGWVQALLRKPVETYEDTQDLATEIGPGRTDYHDFDRRVTQTTCDWLKDPVRHETPWCAFVSWLAPHFPLIAPAKDYARYDPKAYESGPDTSPDHPILRELAAYFDHDLYFTRQSRGIARASYFGLCSFVDAQVGQVLDALEATGLAEDTVIAFTSDHGEMLGEKGFWTKSTMYDSAVRVPLLMAGPDIAPGTWDSPVSLIDLAPTICGVLGVKGSFSGVDLTKPDANRVILSEYHDGGCSVGITMLRWDDWKLVYYAEGHAPQLFNLASDPCEQIDLSLTEPVILQSGLDRLKQNLDPEQVNRDCFADQTKQIEALGGVEAVRSREQFGYTPADSQ
ncbi:MAG: sulfatase-like hydrolase/transferase [Aliishimia sp.]